MWQIAIILPTGQKIVKNKCTLNDLFETYFQKLDSKLKSEIPAEELFDKYQEFYSNQNIKVIIQYVDSWGHTWKGKVAWPRKDKFIELLNKKMNENYS